MSVDWAQLQPSVCWPASCCCSNIWTIKRFDSSKFSFGQFDPRATNKSLIEDRSCAAAAAAALSERMLCQEPSRASGEMSYVWDLSSFKTQRRRLDQSEVTWMKIWNIRDFKVFRHKSYFKLSPRSSFSNKWPTRVRSVPFMHSWRIIKDYPNIQSSLNICIWLWLCVFFFLLFGFSCRGLRWIADKEAWNLSSHARPEWDESITYHSHRSLNTDTVYIYINI